MKPKVRAREISRRKTDGRQVDGLALAADHRGREIDLDVEAEAALVGEKLGEGLALRDADGLENLEVAAGDALQRDADLVDGIDEGSRAAVEDRNFRPVDLDEHVVDAEAGKGRHEVFDGGDRARIAVADDGAQLGGGDGQVPRVDETVQAARKAGAEKSNAMVRFSRMKDRSSLHLRNGRRFR